MTWTPIRLSLLLLNLADSLELPQPLSTCHAILLSLLSLMFTPHFSSCLLDIRMDDRYTTWSSFQSSTALLFGPQVHVYVHYGELYTYNRVYCPDVCSILSLMFQTMPRGIQGTPEPSQSQPKVQCNVCHMWIVVSFYMYIYMYVLPFITCTYRPKGTLFISIITWALWSKGKGRYVHVHSITYILGDKIPEVIHIYVHGL